MTNELSELQEQTGLINHGSVFSNFNSFSSSMKMARALISSTLVPKEYQGEESLGNALIALEVAQRTKSSPLMVMQNLYIVHGRPGWSSQFIIASLNSCGKFSPLRFDLTGEGDERTCIAWALEKSSDERLEGPPVSIAMAKLENWYQKNGSKWKTIPELMLRYRAAAFFGRLYAPEILMGMQTSEEIDDVKVINKKPEKAASLSDLLGKKERDATPVTECKEETEGATNEPESIELKPGYVEVNRDVYPQSFEDNGQTAWVDISGEYFNKDAHKWSEKLSMPVINKDGSFRKLPSKSNA